MSGTSVVIAARNPGPLLAETLSSVAAQTRPPSSIIVVDDGSTDGAVPAAAAAFPAVTVIRQEPLGRSAARNRGAAATDSDFLLFLDADDLLRPASLEVLEAAIQAEPSVEMVHGRVFEFVDRRNLPPPGVRQNDTEVRLRLGGSTLLRRPLWDRVGPLDERIPRGEWIDWVSRASHHGARTVEIHDVVLERRLHSANSASPDDVDTHYLAVIRGAIRRKREEGNT